MFFKRAYPFNPSGSDVIFRQFPCGHQITARLEFQFWSNRDIKEDAYLILGSVKLSYSYAKITVYGYLISATPRHLHRHSAIEVQLCWTNFQIKVVLVIKPFSGQIPHKLNQRWSAEQQVPLNMCLLRL